MTGTTAGPKPAFPIPFLPKPTVQPFCAAQENTEQDSRWVGCEEGKEGSQAWSSSRVRGKAVSSGLREAEVRATALSKAEEGFGPKPGSPLAAACCWRRGHARVLLSHRVP